MKQKVAIETIYFLLILLFAYAAFSKLLDYTAFKAQLGNSPFVRSFAGVIAWLIPTIELIIVGMLTVKDTRIMGLYSSLVLLMIFTLYIAGMLLSGEDLPCSCGGIISTLSWKQHLVFNLFFMALSIVGIGLWWKQKQDILIINK